MSHASSLKLGFKLCALAVLLGSLAFLASNPTGSAQTGPGCDNNYQYCYTTCQSETDPEDCVSGPDGCDTQFFQCQEAADPPRQQPRQPCPPCLQACEFNAEQCRASGELTWQQCALMAYKCKQRCNYMCIY